MAEAIFPNFVNAFAQGREIGREIRQQKISDNALSKFSAGDRAGGINELMTVDPRQAMQLQAYDQQQQGIERARTVGGLAANGDYGAAKAAALREGDFDLVSGVQKLDADQRALVAQHAGETAAVALGFKGIPLEQRAAKFAELRPTLEQRGYKPEELEKVDLSDAGLDAIIHSGLTIKDAIAMQDQERDRAERERHNRAVESRPVVIGNGGVIYDQDQGGIVARNPKTFAPKSGRAGSGPSLPPGYAPR